MSVIEPVEAVPDLMTFLASRASAWRGDAMASATGVWTEKISDAEADELRALVARGVPAGRTWSDLRAKDLPLPLLAPRIAQWRKDIDTERGFLLIQRLPVEEWTEEQSCLAYWAICTHLGEPLVQDSKGTMLGRVRDEGRPVDHNNPEIRYNQTAGKLRFHVDFSDIVGLLCLKKAREGGLSSIVSSHSVVAEIIRRRPDLAPTLFEPIPFDRLDMKGSDGLSWRMVPLCRWRHGDLRVSFQADPIERAQVRGEAPRLTPQQADMVRMVEEIAEDPAFHLNMDMQEGEMQFINNNHTLHSRTSYVDQGDPSQRRHLLRAWLRLA